MADEHVLQAVVEGRPHRIRLASPVDEAALERLARLTFTPLGGVHVCFHVPADPEGKDFYRMFREKAPGMTAYVGYTMFETDRIPEPWIDACNGMDEIWVPTRFNVETFSRSGVRLEKLKAIPFEFDGRAYRPDETPPLEVGRRRGFNFLSIFEWTHRKGWDVLIRAYLEAFDRSDDVRLILRAYQGGGVLGKAARPVVEQLRSYITELGYDPAEIPEIEFIDLMVPDAWMPNLYRAADAFVLPTRGEGWGIPFTESMLMEVPVIATRWSSHLEFMNDENSYLIDIEGLVPVGKEQVLDNPLYAGHQWAQPSVAHARDLMRYVYEHREEAKEKGRAARNHILTHFTGGRSSAKVAARLMALERRHAWKIAAGAGAGGENKGLSRVLFCIRPELFTVPREDTCAVLGCKSRLERAGIAVDLTAIPDTPLEHYDLVHVWCNDDIFALNAAVQGKPFTATPVRRPTCGFDAESMKVVSLFGELLNTWNTGAFEEGLFDLRRGALPDLPEDCGFLFSEAEAVFVSGRSEWKCLVEHFPGVRRAEVTGPGFDRPSEAAGVSADLFVSRYGIKDFVLCTGPLEAEYNQLMLLYALRGLDLPIVFADSDTNQIEYERLCKRFKGRGKVVYTGELSGEMRFSACKAARVLVQPGWHAFPRAALLEAAWLGRPVVVSARGPAAEFLKDGVFLCDPLDPDSMTKAVLEALERPSNAGAAERLEAFSFERQVERVLDVYREVHRRARTPEGAAVLARKAEEARREIQYREWKIQAYAASRTKAGDAFELARELSGKRPNDPFLQFLLGTACMKRNDPRGAEAPFRRCVELNPVFNPRGYLGLALSLLRQERHAEAMEVLLEGLDYNPLAPKDTQALMVDYLKVAGKRLISV